MNATAPASQSEDLAVFSGLQLNRTRSWCLCSSSGWFLFLEQIDKRIGGEFAWLGFDISMFERECSVDFVVPLPCASHWRCFGLFRPCPCPTTFQPTDLSDNKSAPDSHEQIQPSSPWVWANCFEELPMRCILCATVLCLLPHIETQFVQGFLRVNDPLSRRNNMLLLSLHSQQ